MLTYHLDSSARMPLYEQLYRAIRCDILSGVLPGGDRLPSKRQLAQHLEISCVTVETAYGQLVAEGYLISRPKRGFFVQSVPLATEQTVFTPAPTPPATLRYRFDFSTGAVDPACFPFGTWAKLSRAVLTDYADRLLLAVPPHGCAELRQAIAQYLRAERGLTASPENIIIGAGAEYLLQLLILLLGRNRIYALEDPGYRKLYRIFDANGAAVRPIPLDENGLSAKALLESDASVVCLTPAHHFPTGVVMPASRRAEILAWAKDGRYILEDDYDSEFRFSSRPIPTLKELDAAGRVIYSGTFAKSLAPSLRIAFLVLPDALMQQYQRTLSFYSSTVPSFEQHTLARFLSTGAFERHINRSRTLYRARRDALLNALRTSSLAPRLTIRGADAGLHLLVQVAGLSERELIDRAQTQAVRVYGLSDHFSNPAACPPSTVLLGFAGVPAEHMSDAAARLVAAWT